MRSAYGKITYAYRTYVIRKDNVYVSVAPYDAVKTIGARKSNVWRVIGFQYSIIDLQKSSRSPRVT